MKSWRLANLRLDLDCARTATRNILSYWALLKLKQQSVFCFLILQLLAHCSTCFSVLQTHIRVFSPRNWSAEVHFERNCGLRDRDNFFNRLHQFHFISYQTWKVWCPKSLRKILRIQMAERGTNMLCCTLVSLKHSSIPYSERRGSFAHSSCINGAGASPEKDW